MPKRNKDLAEQIGRRIAKRRKELNLTQEEAAERAELSLQFLACVERGIKGLGSESIVKLSRALDTSADYLLTGAMTGEESGYIQRLLTPMNEEQRQAVEEIIKKVLLVGGYEIPEK